MSNEIEQRVVEMRFDNKHFENNVSTTMSTLDKLKQKLHLDGATRGLESVDRAAKNVNMSGLAAGVEAVSVKFSALQVMGITALTNITNSAVNAGKRIVSALTIDPVKTGLSEYETKINAIQVIQANTRSQYTTEEIASGKQMNDITSALEELNDYADKTIYNYAQMTSNVGKFVAQGLSAREASKAVQGLANLAAASGASAEDMSRATYQMSQALGGTIRLIDWNSLRNANMATVDLKNTLMDLARANDIAIDDMIEKHGTFEQTLSEGWLTGKMFSEAMNIYSGVYSEAELKSKGFTDSQVENFMQLAKMAESAATEVKTFTQLWDVLKETAQSGWTQTWELIIGDFETAKKTLSQVQAYFSGIIDGFSDARNFIIGGVMNIAKPWDKIVEKLEGSGLGKIKDAVEKVGELTDKVKYFQDVVTEVWQGKYKTSDTGRFELLEKAGYDHRVVQDLVNKGYQYKITVEDIEESHKKFGLTLETTKEETKEATKAFNDLSDEQLKNAGLTEDEIELYRALEKEADRTGTTIGELVDKMSKRSGRTMLIDSIKNAWKGLVKVLEIARDAFVDIFNPLNSGEIIVKLYNVVEAIYEFSKKLTLVDEETGELTDTAKKLQRVFEGVFAIINTVVTILSGPLKFAFKVIMSVLDNFGIGVLDIMAGIGDAAVKFNDAIDKTVGALTKFIVDNVSEWIEAFRETEFFKTIAEWFEDASEAISDAVDKISEKIASFNTSKFMEHMRAFYNFVTNVWTGIKESDTYNAIADGISEAFTKLKDAFSGFGAWIKGIVFPEPNVTSFRGFIDAVDRFTSSSSEGIGKMVGAVGEWMKEKVFYKLKTVFKNLSSISWDEFVSLAVTKFSNFWLAVGDKVKKALEKVKEVFGSITKFLFGAEKVDLPTILGVAEKILGIVVLIKALNTLNALAEPFDNVTDALNNLAASVKWKAISDTFKSMAIALGVFAVCMLVVSRIPAADAYRSAGILAGLIVIMGGVIVAMGWFAGKLNGAKDAFSVGAGLVMIVGAIALLVYTIKEIDQLTLKNPGKTFGILFGTLLAFAIGIKSLGKAAGTSFKSVAAILTLVTALNMLLNVITAYDEYDWGGKGDAILKMVGMLAMISLALNISSRGIKGGGNLTGMATTILAMVISLKLLIGVIEDFGNMETNSLVKGILAVSYMLMLLTGLAFVLGKANEGKVINKGQKNVNSFTGLAFALLAVVGAIWILGRMATKDADGFIRGGAAVAAILLLFTGMLYAVGKSCSGLKIGTVVTMMIMIGILMAEMAIIIKLLESVPWQSSVGFAGGFAAVLLAMTLAVRTISKCDVKVGVMLKWVGVMVALSGIIYVLANVLLVMQNVPWQSALGNAAALSLLLGVMTGVLAATSRLTITGDTWGAIGALAVLGIVVLELGVILSAINTMNPASNMDNVLAISALLVVMTGVLSVLSLLKVTGNIAAPIVALGALGLVVLELGWILSEINGMDIGEAMPAVKALSTLILVLTVVLAALTGLGVVLSSGGSFIASGGLVVAIAALGALGLVVWELGGILNAMKSFNLGEAGPMVEVLSKLIITLTGVLAALTVMGLFGPAALLGVVSMAALGLVVWELGAILNKLQEYDLGSAMSTIDALSVMLDIMVGVLQQLTIIGVFAGFAIAGVAALTIAITALGGLILLIGAMVTEWEGVEAYIDKGIEILNKIAVGLGSAIGGFVDSLLGSIGNGLVSLGESLSAFMVALTPFIDTVRGVDDSVIKGAGNLAGAIIALLAADLISKIADILPGGGLSLTDLAAELSSFGVQIGDFIGTMKEIDPNAAVGVKSLCDAISTLTATSFWDSLGDKILGGDSLSSFGSSISSFATCIKDAANSLKNITDDDVENIKRSATAGTELAKLADAVPRSGGIWQDFVGKKDLESFGESITAFADCLVNYSEKVSGKNIDAKAIETSAAAAKHVVDVANALPPSGGVWQEWTGEKSLATFGETLVVFGDCLAKYNDKVTGKTFDPDAISASAEAGKKLAEVADAIPPSGGKWQEWVSGEKNLATFGKSLTDFGQGILDYSNVAIQIDDTKIAAIEKTGTAIDKIKTAIEKIPESGGWGDKVFGSNDAQTFGNGLASLAVGINTYCIAAQGIGEDDLAAIENSKTAIEKFKEIITAIPETSTCDKAESMSEAVVDLKIIADNMNVITANNYDYTGLARLKTQIFRLSELFGQIDTESMEETSNNLYYSIVELKSCAEELGAIAEINYDGIDNFKAALDSLSSVNIQGVIDTFSGKGEEIASSLGGLVSSMASAISNNSANVTTAMSDLVSKVVNAAKNKAKEFKSVGANFVSALVSGIDANTSDAKNSGTSLGAQASTGARLGYTGMHGAGQFLGSGLVLGIMSKWQAAYDAGYAIGQAAVQGEKDGQQSASPSKATIKSGKWLGEGLVIGIGKMARAVYNASYDLGDTASGSISSAIARIADMVNNDIDAQPTIRPVLDLSDVESGISSIGGMFGSPIGTLSMAGRINTSMNTRSQNGGNSDLVSEISKLRNDIGKMNNTTYQINGVTYDDGSNVSNAVRTIVRAARIERRV